MFKELFLFFLPPYHTQETIIWNNGATTIENIDSILPKTLDFQHERFMGLQEGPVFQIINVLERIA
jgi:hypothetical protein